MKHSILDFVQFASGMKPVDLGTAGAASDYVSLKNYDRAAFVFYKAAGVAAEDATLTLSQATKVDGTGKKNLNFARYAYKVGTDLEAVGQFTHVNDNADNAITVAGATEALIVVDVDATELDVNGGFDCVIAELTDPGTTGVLGAGIWLLYNSRFIQTPLLSAITD
jgi:hypothetical protein